MHTNKIKANIANVLRQATLTEYHDGLGWYSYAQSIAHNISTQCDVPLETVADVIAALSPNCAWSQNIADAWKVCRAWHDFVCICESPEININITPEVLTRNLQDKSTIIGEVRVTTYTRNRDKAFRILAGTDKLSGRKVECFAANIRGDLQTVTIDTHAISIAYAQRFTVRTCPNISPSEFKQIQKCYALVAEDVNREKWSDVADYDVEAITNFRRIYPAQIQAITWRTWRRIHRLTRASELTARLF